MDVIKAEIERKKRLLAESKVVGPEKKYFKRGELIEKQRQEYLAKHAPNTDDVQKRVQEIEAAKKSAKQELVRSTEDDDEGPSLSREEVIRLLRDKCQPIWMFGETESEACGRLMRLQVEEPDVLVGHRNDYKEAMDKVDQAYLNEILNPSKEESPEKHKNDFKLYESSLSYDDLMDMANDLDKGDVDHDYKVVAEFIKVIMTMWQDELEKRPDPIRLSVKGKMEKGTFEQTKLYLKPLLRMVKKQTVSDDIRDSLVIMIKHTLQRDYIMANEAYMEMAIGNAPWPIGVTNAGIHARPGREKIFSKNVAHVLNDELQRKFIQGLKRLLTKCQQYYPTDPSRSIDFVRTKSPDSP